MTNAHIVTFVKADGQAVTSRMSGGIAEDVAKKVFKEQQHENNLFVARLYTDGETFFTLETWARPIFAGCLTETVYIGDLSYDESALNNVKTDQSAQAWADIKARFAPNSVDVGYVPSVHLDPRDNGID